MKTETTKATSTKRSLTIAKNDGFSILDISIILLVLGFLSAPLIQEYREWDRADKKGGTENKIADIEDALKVFFLENQHYPCPAIQTLGPNSIVPPNTPEFGDENRLAPIGPPGTVGNCVVPVGPVPAFLTGSLPFKDLKLTSDDVLDRWENKITYTVTTTQTHPTTYNGANGALTINKPLSLQATAAGEKTCQANPIPVVSNIHLVLFSHGENGTGAFTNNGAQPQACAPGTLESENCDNDVTFIFPECTHNEIAGANFYDDLMYSQYDKWDQTQTNMWEIGNNPNDTGSQAGFFGLGNPNPRHTLDVMGNIKTTNSNPATDATDGKRGNALASDFCDSNGVNCFDPNSIAKDDPNMNCAAGHSGLSGIKTNNAQCINTIPTPTPKICLTGQYIINITAAGVITCG